MYNVTDMFQEYNEVQDEFDNVDSLLNERENLLIDPEQEQLEIDNLYKDFLMATEVTEFIAGVETKIKEQQFLSPRAATVYLDAIQMKTKGELCESIQVGLENISNSEGGFKEIALEGIGDAAKKWAVTAGKKFVEFMRKVMNSIRRGLGYATVYETGIRNRLKDIKKMNPEMFIYFRFTSQASLDAFKNGKWDKLAKTIELYETVFEHVDDGKLPEFKSDFTMEDMDKAMETFSISTEKAKNALFAKMKKIPKDELVKAASSDVVSSAISDTHIFEDSLVFRPYAGVTYLDSDTKKHDCLAASFYYLQKPKNDRTSIVQPEAVKGVESFIESGVMEKMAALGKKGEKNFKELGKMLNHADYLAKNAASIKDENVRESAMVMTRKVNTYYRSMLLLARAGVNEYKMIADAIYGARVI